MNIMWVEIYKRKFWNFWKTLLCGLPQHFAGCQKGVQGTVPERLGAWWGAEGLRQHRPTRRLCNTSDQSEGGECVLHQRLLAPGAGPGSLGPLLTDLRFCCAVGHRRRLREENGLKERSVWLIKPLLSPPFWPVGLTAPLNGYRT